MTFELQVLVASVILGLVHLVLVAQLSNYHRGYVRWAASARDQVAQPLPPVPARLEGAYRNYLETFPYFAATILIAHVANVHGRFTE